MLLSTFILLFGVASLTEAYKNPNFWDNRTGIVQLLEWKWNDVAAECENFLGPRNFGGVQISPPNENVAVWSQDRPWWERYEPISYALVSRSGNQAELISMVRRCNAAGVRVYADVVLNHMTATRIENFGTAGNTANYALWSYPAVPYTQADFYFPTCPVVNYHDAYNVRNCELNGKKDLLQSSENVRSNIVNYLNLLINIGVAGFRIDAAKHMWPADLNVIYSRLIDLNTLHGFLPGSRPFINQDVIDVGNEAVRSREYTDLGVVAEHRVGWELSRSFRGGNLLRWFINWGPGWDLLPSEDAVAFIDDHETQRGLGGGGNVLTYKEPKRYRAALGFVLTHSYGQARIMSSFRFDNINEGPPSDIQKNIISPTFNEDGSCADSWVCEHRWRQVYELISFRNAVAGTEVQGFWDNGGNQIAFRRGNAGFAAFNIENFDLSQTIQTGLPAGSYCDVVSGSKVNGACQGKTVNVDAWGNALIIIRASDEDHVLAIHVGKESRL